MLTIYTIFTILTILFYEVLTLRSQGSPSTESNEKSGFNYFLIAFSGQTYWLSVPTNTIINNFGIEYNILLYLHPLYSV